MAASPNRVAANHPNARKSTGPRTPEGKARSSQNARKHPFNPDPFAIVRIEDRDQIAALVADGVPSGPDTYQPINSQERDAVERIALAKHSMRRMSVLEAGFFTNCSRGSNSVGSGHVRPRRPIHPQSLRARQRHRYPPRTAPRLLARLRVQ